MRPVLRRGLSTALQLAAGALVVVAAAQLAGGLARRFSRPHQPPGWQLFWYGHEVSAVALAGPLFWAGGTDGLMAIDRRTLMESSVRTPRLRYVRGLLSGGGDLWAAHAAGIERLSHGRWEHFDASSGLPRGVQWSLASSGGSVWCGGEGGLAVWNGSGFRLVASSAQLALEAVEAIYRDPLDGALWLTCASPRQGGVVRFDGTRFESWTHHPGLAHTAVSAVMRDHSGALWFATGFAHLGGASVLRDGHWTTLTRRDGLAGDKARSLFEDPSGRLWIGSEYEGVAVLDAGRTRVLTPRAGLAGWEVKSMARDGDGALWLGTESGITRIQGEL